MERVDWTAHYLGTCHQGRCGGEIVERRWVERDLDGRACAQYRSYVCSACLAEVDDQGFEPGWAACRRCGDAWRTEQMVCGDYGWVCEGCGEAETA